MNRQISRVALVSLVMLGALIVATTYWQTWATGGLAARQDNEIKRVAQFEIRRGKIYAANGRTVLATNVRKKAGGKTLYFRTYPTHGFASQAIGYSTQSRSRAGLEREENSYLTASDKNVGTVITRLGDQLKGATITGNDLWLNLKPGPQRLAQRLLAGKCGAAVVLNPKTGAVYVMASSPTYDPNLIETPSGYAKIQATKAPCTPSAPLLNRATQGLYPPGSTFKIVTASAALESGKFRPDSTFYDPGYCTEYGKPVYNAGNADADGPERFGNLDLVTAFKHSVNAVFCNIGKQLGAGRVLEQAKKFGFYSTPPLETPSDARSGSGLYVHHKLFNPKDPNTQVDPGRLAFGQERMLVTPLQMAMVAAGIANHGTVMTPRLVKQVVAPDGDVIAKPHPRVYSHAVSRKTADAIRDMMVAAVQGGTGTQAQIPGVTVAGKTGTAETGRPGVYHAWFVFFAPAENPVLAGAVVVESQVNGFGGSVSAPIAKQLMQAILPPDVERHVIDTVTTTTDPLLNRLFDRRYLIRRKLGSGGMAAVYLAEDQELGRRVALKLLDDRHASDEQFVERFRREAQNAAGLNHPNIVSIFDRGHAEDTYYIAMEFLDGRTLKELVVRNGPTPIPIAIDYARQILQALAFAHRHGIVHRDIKPHNIVVGHDGRLKVTDFGIARSGSSQMTEAGSIVGTAQYLSPEQARGAQVDPRSDLYSLGIVMYEMLTGTVPFTGDAPVEIAMKHLSSVPDPPSKSQPKVPHALDAVVMRALAKDPDERFDSAEEMDADLARVARGLAVSRRTEEAATQVMRADDTAGATMVARPRTTPPAPPVYRPPGAYYEERPRRTIWPWILGLLALAIAGGTGYLLYDKIQNQLDQNRPVTVADVGLEQQTLAKQQLEAQGFHVRTIKLPNRTVAVGAVIRQDPAGGEPQPKGSTVTLYVSTGIPKSTVPPVVGLSQTDAITALVHAGLNANPNEIYSSEPSGTVTGQNPKAGEIVPSASSVRINVSLGERLAGVPSVIGQPYANAASALQGAGFTVVRVDGDSDEPKGTVIAQDPAGGSNVAQRSKVTVTVSKGPVTADVPSVTGDTLADAEQLIADAGFKSTVEPQDVTDPSQDGLVLAQDPASGPLEKGSTVTLFVGRLVSTPVETPPADTTTAETTTTDAGPTSPTPP